MSFSNNFPTIKPSLLLDFANTKQLDPRITFTRASTATYYDGKTTAMAEQNLLTYSQDFDNAAWAKYQSTVTANVIAAPDGTTTADKVIATAVSGSHVIYQSAGTNGIQQFVSVYAKAAEYTNLQICLNGTGSSNAVFDLTAVTATSVIGTTASITSVGNGWYRCVAVMTPQANTAVAIQGFPAGATANNYGNIFTGDGTSGIYIWGAQVEQRSSVTAYTATTTAPITNYIPVLQTAASGVARFDNNPTTGESLGLLIEEQRTNLLTYSSDYSNAAWNKSSASITTAANVAPDGTVTAQKIISSAAFGQAYQLVSKATSAVTYAYSVYAKAGELSNFQLYVDSTPSGAGQYLRVNLATGSLISQGSTGTGSAFVSYSITSVGNGWYRLVLVMTSDASNNVQAHLSCIDSGSGFGGIYIWGAQLEAGAFATSYIATTSAQVTRAADAAGMTGTNFSSWFKADEGTVYAESTFPQVTSSRVVDLWANSTNYIAVFRSGSNLVGEVYNGSSQAFLSIASSNNNKFTLSYKVNDVAASLNASAVSTDTVATMPSTTPSTLYIGAYGGGGNIINGTIKKIAYYPARIPNNQLQALTS